MLMNYLCVCVVFGLLCLPTAVRSYHILKEFQSHPNWKLLDRGEDCGYSSSDRIIGGVKATLGQYPWIARLGYRFDEESDSTTYECGATIINNRYVLTAAHCGPEVMGTAIVQVRLGEYDANSEPDCLDGQCAPPVQDIEVEQTICHSGYAEPNLQHDICLIRLVKPIQFNKFVYPACLPAYDYFQSNDFKGTIMEVAGWGITNIETKSMSDVLLTLKVPIVDHSSCASKYLDMVKVTETQMCAGGVVGKDSCGGDSGGPLMNSISLDAPPRYFVVGIVSFGFENCAESTTPGVYTNVFLHMKWILDNIRK